MATTIKIADIKQIKVKGSTCSSALLDSKQFYKRAVKTLYTPATRTVTKNINSDPHLIGSTLHIDASITDHKNGNYTLTITVYIWRSDGSKIYPLYDINFIGKNLTGTRTYKFNQATTLKNAELTVYCGVAQNVTKPNVINPVVHDFEIIPYRDNYYSKEPHENKDRWLSSISGPIKGVFSIMYGGEWYQVLETYQKKTGEEIYNGVA